MNYGLYLAASGALSNLHRQDVLTNNLANSETVGFKPDMVFGRQRLPERLASGGFTDPKPMLERLGGAATLDPTRASMTQGSVTPTDNDLDVAIEGDGYFVVRNASGGESFTRDGRFTLNAGGELVQASSGLPVLDDQDRPIRVNRAEPVVISHDGTISQRGKAVATIRLAAPRDPDGLVKVGATLLRPADGGAVEKLPADGRILQRFVEASAVNAISTLRDLTNAVKAFQANIKMMQYHDHLMGQAINTLGRVA